MEGLIEHGKHDFAELLKTDVNYEEYLSKQKEKFPEQAEILDEMLKFANQKLYHELTDCFISYIRRSDLNEFQKVEFFRFCVDFFKSKINPINFVQMLAYVCSLIDGNDALKLFDLYEEFLATDLEANFMFLTAKAENKCRSELYKDSEKILEEVKEKLDVNGGVDLSIFASFHKSYSMLFKATNRLTEFYRHSLLYLSYTPLQDINEEEKDILAYNLSIAAILSKDIYEFAELLEVSVVKENLKNGKNCWLFEFLVAFRNGDLKCFDLLCKNYQSVLLRSELVSHEKEMREKITLLALMELAFNRPKNLRKIKFVEIAEYCDISIDQVERIVMLSMSNNLIKGKIDEVEQIVNITSIKPRILDNQRLEIMRERMEIWSDSAKELLLHLEGITPELLVS